MTTMASWGVASELLAAAGVAEDTSYYGRFTSENEKAVLTVAMRIQAAWASNDADAFANTFAENGSLLMQDTQLTSREEIRSYMASAFTGPLKGARVKGWPIEVKFLTDNAAMAVTEGGVLLPGETDIPDQSLIRATWVIMKGVGGELSLMSHQGSPIRN